MSIAELTKKKVIGIPVPYLAVGGVVILVVVAVKTKSVPTESEAVAAEPEGDLASRGPIGGDVYPSMPEGTVIVAPVTSPEVGPSNTEIADNDTWLRRGVALLIKNGKNPGSAQVALQLYLDGGNMTYEQGIMRDMVIREFGIPPFAGSVGSTGSAPLPPAGPSPVYVSYVRDSAGKIYGVTAAGTRTHLSAAVYAALGRPRYTQLPPVPAPKPAPKPVVPKSTPKPAPPNTRKYPGHTLQIGSTGHDVTLVQARVHVATDGKFGPATAAAVKRFQTSKRLAADGIVGKLTWDAMF